MNDYGVQVVGILFGLLLRTWAPSLIAEQPLPPSSEVVLVQKSR